MPYGDEEIIRARVAAEAKRRHTISNEVTIDGEKYTFAEYVFIDSFSMVVPESFTDLPDELADIKYPARNRPKIILSIESGTVNINLSHEKSPVEPIAERVKNYRGIIKKLNPSNVFFSQGIFESNDIQIGHYDFRSPTLGKDVYNIHVVFDIDDIEMFLGFNCPVDVQKQWEPLIRQMIKTIKLQPQEDK
jgi:hypothetical protein